MKSVILTLANCINELREIIEGIEETSACFKRGKIFFILNPYVNPDERRKIEFS